MTLAKYLSLVVSQVYRSLAASKKCFENALEKKKTRTTSTHGSRLLCWLILIKKKKSHSGSIYMQLRTKRGACLPQFVGQAAGPFCAPNWLAQRELARLDTFLTESSDWIADDDGKVELYRKGNYGPPIKSLPSIILHHIVLQSIFPLST